MSLTEILARHKMFGMFEDQGICWYKWVRSLTDLDHNQCETSEILDLFEGHLACWHQCDFVPIEGQDCTTTQDRSQMY